MQVSEIDWNAMWQEARLRKSWKKKKQGDWDKRASGFARRNIDSDYANRFLELMRPRAEWRVLDVGCGPGTLALPLAERVQAVTAVDFSAAMLDELQNRAQQLGLGNIATKQASWTDDWRQHAICVHDVAVASRSLSVFDLRAALEKLDAWARRKVYISDRVGSGPFDPDMFAAVGRSFDPGPDYIYTVNLLYQMGIHPMIDYIELPRTKEFADREAALASCAWMLDDLSDTERKRLDRYVDERLEPTAAGTLCLRGKDPIRWALISWEKMGD